MNRSDKSNPIFYFFSTVVLMLILVLIFSAAEILYRIKLRIPLSSPPPTETFFHVSTEPVYELDKKYGYRYIPNKETITIGIREGLPVFLFRKIINENGNIGNAVSKEEWQDAHIKMLCFGDSFTANPNYGGITWVDYVGEKFLNHSVDSVKAINYGQDGTGLLSMVSLAVDRIVKQKPNFAVIAFISKDLTRPRVWRGKFMIDGKEVYQQRFDHPKIVNNAVPLGYYDKRINERWFAKVSKEKDRQDPLLKNIIKNVTKLSQKRPNRNLFFNYSHSYLLNFLFKKDSYYGLSNQLTIKNFEDDPQMKKDLLQLANLNIPVVFIHLPMLNELYGKRYTPAAETFLMASLTATTENHRNFYFIDLIDYLRPAMSDRDFRNFTMQEYNDTHPSEHGSELYAAAIVDALIQRQIVVNSTKHSDPGNSN